MHLRKLVWTDIGRTSLLEQLERRQQLAADVVPTDGVPINDLFSGETALIEVQYANQGDSTAIAGRKVRVAIQSAEQAWQFGRTYIEAEGVISDDLVSGEESSLIVRVPLAGMLAGENYKIYLQIDNNWIVVPDYVTIGQPRVDFGVRVVSSTLPAEVGVGQPFKGKQTIVVANDGAIITGAGEQVDVLWTLMPADAAEDDPSTGTLYYKGTLNVARLRPGAERQFTRNVSGIMPEDAGSWVWRVDIISRRLQTDVENDYDFGDSMEAVEQTVNLTFGRFDVVTRTARNGVANSTALLIATNDGTGPADRSAILFTIQAVTTDGDTIEVARKRIVRSFKPGQSTGVLRLALKLTDPALKPGQYTLQAVMEVAEELGETNCDDNIKVLGEDATAPMSLTGGLNDNTTSSKTTTSPAMPDWAFGQFFSLEHLKPGRGSASPVRFRF